MQQTESSSLTRFYVELTVDQREQIRQEAKLTHDGDMRALVKEFIVAGLERRSLASPEPGAIYG